jgi:hypothetical protein
MNISAKLGQTVGDLCRAAPKPKTAEPTPLDQASPAVRSQALTIAEQLMKPALEKLLSEAKPEDFLERPVPSPMTVYFFEDDSKVDQLLGSACASVEVMTYAQRSSLAKEHGDEICDVLPWAFAEAAAREGLVAVGYSFNSYFIYLHSPEVARVLADTGYA